MLRVGKEDSGRPIGRGAGKDTAMEDTDRRAVGERISQGLSVPRERDEQSTRPECGGEARMQGLMRTQ